MVDEPFLGKFKVYTDETRIDNKIKLDFKIKEYSGVEAYGDQELRRLLVMPLSVGDVVYFSGLFNDIIEMKVVDVNPVYAESEHFLACLSFGKDDRKCWVVDGLINKAAESCFGI